MTRIAIFLPGRDDTADKLAPSGDGLLGRDSSCQETDVCQAAKDPFVVQGIVKDSILGM